MEFFETSMGKSFFMKQVPELIQALQDIAGKLEKKQEPIRLTVNAPENFLDELYHGNVEFGVYSKEGFHREDLKQVTDAQQRLHASLSEEQWKLFLEYNALSGNYAAQEAGRMYKTGFRQAVQLIAAGLRQDNNEEKAENI